MKWIPHLRDIHEAIGDPEIFTIEYARDALKDELSHGASDRFCGKKRSERRVDPIRVNRIRLLLKIVINATDFLGGVEGGVCLELVGEGTCVPVSTPFTTRVKLIKFFVASIDSAIEIRQANLAVCGR